jgi:hypothetical protein
LAERLKAISSLGPSDFQPESVDREPLIRAMDAVAQGDYLPLREAHVNQVINNPEIGKIERQEWYLLDSRCCCDGEVELTSTRLAATLCNCCREAPPSASNLDRNLQWVECGFDDRQSINTSSTLVAIAGK